MRITCLTLLAFLLTASIYAQPWLKHLPAGKPTSELTLFDYQKAFETYWAPFRVDRGSYLDNGIKRKAPGWKQFKRWEYQMSSQVDPRTGAFPKKTSLQVREEFLKENPQPRSVTAADWKPVGPTTSFSGYSGIGRINCVAFHPTDINTYWVGAAAGGLWQTTDNGATWKCLTDNNGVLAVSDIIIPEDYDATGTLYIATGDRDAWDNRSIGVLKSNDSGMTWNTTGLSFTIFEGRMVNRLLQDPTNKDIIVAATSIGVFKTNDGGETWNTQMTGTEFIDMEFRPGNPGIIYASTKNGQIYISNDGATFSGPVYSDGNASRIELAVSPAQPEWVYALAANGESGLYGIFKSTDSGATFNEVFSGSTKNMLGWESQGTDSGGQGWYDLSLAASPFDADIILLGGVNCWRSLDGGINWSIANHWWGDMVQAVHADKHKLAYRSNGDLFECSDGGVYMSSNNGGSWTDKTNGIQISQMYRLGVSQTESGDIITGLQDNGTKLHTGDNWSDVRGGDGMECLIDYTDVNIQYGTVYFGQIDRTTNHWQSSQNITPPDEGAWVTPYIIDPNDPNTLYGGYNEVWKTTDRGDNWEQISSFDPNGQLLSMGIAASDSRYLYVATYNQIWKTTNGGTDWTAITNDLPTGGANIEYISVKHDDPNTIWVALSGFGNPGVYQTVDGGASWTSISAGLPPIPVYSVVENKQNLDAVHLYAGTDLGVYFKRGNEDWVAYNTGLPNVRTGEIEIYYAGNPGESKLRVATYGRGLWETPIEYIPTVMSYASSTAVQKNKSNVEPDQVNQEILKVEVVTTGNLQPFDVTSFTFNTDGSTDPAHDISNARLFYTGSSGSFATTTQFGNTVAAPNGTFTINGAQLLSDGKNNFWLTYDLPASAALGNILDAQCTSLVADTEHTLAVSAPEGSRTIGYEYCASGAAQQSYEYISNVTIGAVNQSSGKSENGYGDYSSEVIDLYFGLPADIFVTNGVPYGSDQVLVWVDWNIDGDFEDDGETAFVSDPSGTDVFTGSFTPPATAREGNTRMRVRLHDSGNGPLDKPCGYATWGEVEDYTVRISNRDACSVLNYLATNAKSIDGDYVPLGSDGTVITTSEFDNANSDPQEIGFTFLYKCQPFTQFILNTNGFIKLGDTPPSAANLFFEDARASTGGIFNNNDPDDVNLISPLNLDLTAGTGSPEYRVYTSGEAPNRICTIQYKDVREANTDPIPQYANMQFQIKLYETSNVIEFVYGDWTRAFNGDDFRAVACGLKGSSRAGEQLLIVSKANEEDWKDVQFANANYHSTSALYYSEPPVSPKPDDGRTIRFEPIYNNDLAIGEIYSMGDASIYYSSPQNLGVNIKNEGWTDRENIPVTLSITGANAVTETNVIAGLGQSDYFILQLPAFIPEFNGPTTIKITLPDDDNLSNNTITWQQNVNEFDINYASTLTPSSPMALAQGDALIYQAKYYINTSVAVQSIKTFIPYDLSNIGQSVYGVVLNHEGVIASQSEPYIISDTSMGKWHTFDMPAPPAFAASDYFFYAGYAATASDEVYYPVGFQSEDPLRTDVFYVSDLAGNNVAPLVLPNRLMIGATLLPTPPSGGTVCCDLVQCEGGSVTMGLGEYSGFIQWQESPDGISNWSYVTAGSGANTSSYTTPLLNSTIYYRAEVTQPTFAPVYSNTASVIILETPADAGPVTGDDTVCQGASGVTYTVDEIQNATDYIWSLPDGVSGTSTTNTITLTFETSAVSGEISVAGFHFGGCLGTSSSLTVTVVPLPATPVITANENILHSDAVSGNQWYNQDGIIPGATDQDFTAIANGDYYVVVTDGECSSAPSNVLQVIISALGTLGDDSNILVYPNPVKDQLTVEARGIADVLPFEIFDAIGHIIHKGEFTIHTMIRTDQYTPGVYYIKIKGDGYVVMRKFVKE